MFWLEDEKLTNYNWIYFWGGLVYYNAGFENRFWMQRALFLFLEVCFWGEEYISTEKNETKKQLHNRACRL